MIVPKCVCYGSGNGDDGSGCVKEKGDDEKYSNHLT